MARRKVHGHLRRHSLSVVTGIVLATWIVAYSFADPSTHWGSFFGNAIADWTGLLVTVLATKYMFEKGSAESRNPPALFGRVPAVLRNHSLTIFLIATGVGWIALFSHMNSEAKWGQVVGNIVSEWTQILGVVVLTKRLVEVHSKESKS